MTELTRRRMVAATGAAGIAAVAGCSSSAEEDDDGPDGTELGQISIENLDDGNHQVDVLVEIEGEIEHWSTHELESKSGATIERDWSSEPGDFRVTIRLDGDEFEQKTPDWLNDPTCMNLRAMVMRDGSLEIDGSPDGGLCGPGDPDFDGDEDDE